MTLPQRGCVYCGFESRMRLRWRTFAHSSCLNPFPPFTFISSSTKDRRPFLRDKSTRDASVATTPLGLCSFADRDPKVARPSQPWAGGHNPFGIACWPFGLLVITKAKLRPSPDHELALDPG